MIFGACERLHPFAVRGAVLVHIFRHGLRTNEGDGLQIGMFQYRVHDGMRPMHDSEHSRREAGFNEQLCQSACQQRGTFRWFKHERVAAGNCEREHPARHHHRKIKRCNTCYDAERIAVHAGFNARGDVRQLASHQECRRTCGKFDAFNPPFDLAERLLQVFAVLSRNESGELFDMLREKLLIPEQIARSLRRGDLAPLSERPRRRRHRLI
ncbi:hypothetical protein D3C84_731670 [compost metagenome]